MLRRVKGLKVKIENCFYLTSNYKFMMYNKIYEARKIYESLN